MVFISSSVGTSHSHCWSVHLLLKWKISPSKFSGCWQVILWNVGNHWVEQVGRLRDSGNHKTSQIQRSYTFISRDGLNRLKRIQSADEKCLCVLACVHELMLLHTRTMSSSSSPETERTTPSFFVVVVAENSVIFFILFCFVWSNFKMLTLYKELMPFLCFISGLSYKEMLQWHHRNHETHETVCLFVEH